MPRRQVTFNKSVEFPALRPVRQLTIDQRRLVEFEVQDGAKHDN